MQYVRQIFVRVAKGNMISQHVTRKRISGCNMSTLDIWERNEKSVKRYGEILDSDHSESNNFMFSMTLLIFVSLL
jgi:hypothetical protein